MERPVEPPFRGPLCLQVRRFFEFPLTFLVKSGEKWGVVAKNVTINLGFDGSGSNHALFGNLRALYGRKEARCRARVVVVEGGGGCLACFSASEGRILDGDAVGGAGTLSGEN